MAVLKYTLGTYNNVAIPVYSGDLIIQVWGGGGAGGPASGSTGNNGNASTVTISSTVLTGNGGYGGTAGYYRRGAGTGGAGGTGSGGDSAITGGAGANGFVGGIGGAGGAAYLGTGGIPANPTGGNGLYPGDGGAGGYFNDGSGSPNYQAGGGGGAGGYSYKTYNTSTLSPGSLINMVIGGGGAANGGGGGGADGAVWITYRTYVPSGPESLGNPASQIDMDSIVSAFLPYGGSLPAKPWGLGSYYAKSVVPYTYAAIGGTPDYNVRTVDDGYGIQSPSDSVYTQTVSRSGSISFGGFANTYQSMPNNRLPKIIDSPYVPPSYLYTQYDIVRYYYTGSPQTFNFYNAKVIRIECWGGSGCTYNGAYTSGGYSQGVYVAPAGGSLYVYVGGAAVNGGAAGDNAFDPGGWNGGGYGYHSYYTRGAGGGATDVRTNYIATVDVAGSNGTLPAYWTQAATLTSLNSRIIVAGGGGGGLISGYPGYGAAAAGVGGGTTGGNGVYAPGYGGTQSSGGLTVAGGGYNGGFGYGGGSYGYPYTISGGGGGYYGGGSGNGGGGGSGYVGGMLPDTTTGSRNFGWNTYNVQTGQTGYATNGGAPNGLCLITILG